MRTITFAVLCFAVANLCADGQGTFVFDQQSGPDNFFGETPIDIQPNQPVGQSFTPALSSAQFVRFYLSDNAFDGIGSTIYVNLKADSITGSVLSSTAPVFLADRFHGVVNFVFDEPVSLTPGTRYFFQPVVQSGESYALAADTRFGYAGGDIIAKGTAFPTFDLWFREGIIIPEPSAAPLVLLGIGMFLFVLKRDRRCHRRVRSEARNVTWIGRATQGPTSESSADFLVCRIAGFQPAGHSNKNQRANCTEISVY